jgi:hypothetical protein
VKIDFDPAKSKKNESSRGLPFELATEFEWVTALYIPDTRRDYGENRIRAFGFFEDRLHAIVFTPIAGGVRIISFRKANKREILRYEDFKKNKP